MKIRNLALVILVSAVALSACEDDLFNFTWVENPDTVELYVLSRPESNLLSAFDFFSRIPKRLEAPTTGDLWDLAVDYQDGQFVWLPPGAMGIASDAAVATLEGHSWLSAREAPADTALYVSDAPIPIRFDPIYVIRTPAAPGHLLGLQLLREDRSAWPSDVARRDWVLFQFDVSPASATTGISIPPG